ncbi:tripartite tricarboxylate transporter TctB family protein [Senegalia massiliensis]|uniref:DUF1468 domain-containing protein n=1 Tax=Senegalia massiliensis TaxID=1720316 RepID=A0A845R3J8_9CLOT|nr:tripartite tricarboxylate transporter TctB family protein [Senegalia massiliensis]NBI07103.1 hypothetical protein [Senegalia massiliensis]
MKKGNIVSGIIIIITSLFFYFNTSSFKKLDNQVIGADFMPKLYAILLIALGIILIIQNYKKEENKEENKESYYKYSLITMVLLLIYIIIIPILGFYSSTILLVLSLLLFSKTQNKIILITIPIATSLFIFLFFDILLNVAMPTGLIF